MSLDFKLPFLCTLNDIEINVHELMGAGSYGKVYKAMYEGEDYAIKYVKEESTDFVPYEEEGYITEEMFRLTSHGTAHFYGSIENAGQRILVLDIYKKPKDLIAIYQNTETQLMRRFESVMSNTLKEIFDGGYIMNDIGKMNVMYEYEHQMDNSLVWQPILIDFGRVIKIDILREEDIAIVAANDRSAQSIPDRDAQKSISDKMEMAVSYLQYYPGNAMMFDGLVIPQTELYCQFKKGVNQQDAKCKLCGDDGLLALVYHDRSYADFKSMLIKCGNEVNEFAEKDVITEYDKLCYSWTIFNKCDADSIEDQNRQINEWLQIESF